MPAKRVMLMYISEVSGHHCATIAIEKELKAQSPGIEVLNINAFNYTNPISEKIVNSIYMGVIKSTPGIWDYLYDNQQVAKKVEKIKKMIHLANSRKLRVLFERFRPDAVICAQAFPCGMVADYKQVYNSDLPLIAVLTDYIPHSYWIYDNVDYYVTPSEEVSSRMVQRGVVPEKIKALGIPCDIKFARDISKYQARQKIGLRQDLFTVLIMGGGHGLGPMKAIVKSLEKLPFTIQELIVTGINKKLYRSMRRKIRKSRQKVNLYGHVANVEELMAAADIVITKPGGVTTAESLTKKLPMIIIHPIPGQEMNNAVFLVEKGAAIKIDDPEEVNSIIEDLVKYPYKLKHLSESAARIGKPNSSRDIAKLILHSING
ncbi:MAG: glycosyltransferase [Candidatus Omnitrophota bacterium]